MNLKYRYISIFQNRYGDIIQLHGKHQILYGHIQKLYNHTYLTYEDSNHTTKCYYDNCHAFAKVLESTKSWNSSPQFFPLLISYLIYHDFYFIFEIQTFMISFFSNFKQTKLKQDFEGSTKIIQNKYN
jgi:hypothetical protein